MACPAAGFHSIDKRFDRDDHELSAIRRDVGLILALAVVQACSTSVAAFVVKI